MDKQFQEYVKKLDIVFSYRNDLLDKCESTDVQEMFDLAYKSIMYFYIYLSKDPNGKEILYDMFGKASEKQLDEVHRLLIFWFFWFRDFGNDFNSLRSDEIRDGLKNIWSFSDIEIDKLIGLFNLEHKKQLGSETYRLWKEIQVILENNKWSPTFVFQSLLASLKRCWIELDM
jgi:hypothetical protein